MVSMGVSSVVTILHCYVLLVRRCSSFQSVHFMENRITTRRGVVRRVTSKPTNDFEIVPFKQLDSTNAQIDSRESDPLLQSTFVEQDKNLEHLEMQSATIETETAAARLNSQFSSVLNTSHYDLLLAAVVGVASGVSIAIFKHSIDVLREFCYGDAISSVDPIFRVLVPGVGALGVALLLLFGDFGPGLRGTVKEVEDTHQETSKLLWDKVLALFRTFRKTVAAAFTLGTGNSLGPEGPCVELGMGISRSVMDFNANRTIGRDKSNRLLLSCGAASGVAAGFNAPIAGVFFALEVMQNAFQSERKDRGTGGTDLFSSTSTITPVLISATLSALMCKAILGEHLVLILTKYSLKSPLLELPLYLLLGTISGFVAFAFCETAKISRSFFDGNLGSERVQNTMRNLPQVVKLVMAGVFCGVVALEFPQILFFGYETLNALLANNQLALPLLISLLAVKTISTAVCVGSGLVGGTFAPALFMGAMTGAAFYDIVCAVLPGVTQLLTTQGTVVDVSNGIADMPAYAMVGAASVLAALFRAPLTASLLLFELTRNYEVILPLMASAGIGSVVGDVLEEKFERSKAGIPPTAPTQRRDRDPVSWGDLSDEAPEPNGAS